MRADDRVEERLMRLVGAVIFVTVLAGARRLSEFWCWLPTEEHVTEYYAGNEHAQCGTAVSALRLRI